MATWGVLSSLARSVQSVQSQTELAPTGSTDGVLLDGVYSIVPVLTAPNGQTFDGTGNILAYYYSNALSRWIRSPRGDDTLADLAGLGEGALPAIPVVSGNGRFAWVCSGVGLSGGTQVTITLICSSSRSGTMA